MEQNKPESLLCQQQIVHSLQHIYLYDKISWKMTRIHKMTCMVTWSGDSSLPIPLLFTQRGQGILCRKFKGNRPTFQQRKVIAWMPGSYCENCSYRPTPLLVTREVLVHFNIPKMCHVQLCMA